MIGAAWCAFFLDRRGLTTVLSVGAQVRLLQSYGNFTRKSFDQ
jgi:hypothetical protein